MKPINRRKIIAAMIMLLMALAACSLLPGCKVQKDINKAEKKDSTDYQRIIDSLIQVKKRDSSKYESVIKNLKSTGVKFKEVPCPPMPNIDASCNEDSLVKVIKAQAQIIRQQSNKVKILTDGSIEAEGDILEANYSVSEYKRQLEQRNISFDSLSKAHDSLKAVSTSQTLDESKSVKRSAKFPWLLFVSIGFVLGFVFRSYISKIPIINLLFKKKASVK